MGLISEETIRRVAEANDIVEVIGSYFPLKRAGTSLRYLRAPQGLRNLAKLCEVDGLLGLG